MALRIEYHPLARVDYFEAIAFYAEKNKKAALRFEEEIIRITQLVADNPYIGKPQTNTTRSFALAHYPFKLRYAVREESILIVSFSHTSREPEHWKDRLEEA